MLRGAIKKLLCIIAAAMALVAASSTAMAEPKKRSDATHRMKSPGSDLRHFVNGLPTIQHMRNTSNLNAKVGTKKIRLDASIKHSAAARSSGSVSAAIATVA